jgi:hypothetical protein
LMFLKALATAKECQNKCCKRHFYQSKHSWNRRFGATIWYYCVNPPYVGILKR